MRLVYQATLYNLGFVRVVFNAPLSGPNPALKHIFYPNQSTKTIMICKIDYPVKRIDKILFLFLLFRILLPS